MTFHARRCTLWHRHCIRGPLMLISEQTLFQRFFDAFSAARSLLSRALRAAQCIRDCGTRAMGAHVLSCPTGACEQLQFHACRHRSCPRCAQASRQRWTDSELHRLLPCPHWHVIVTLPHELLPLWSLNRALFINLFMRCVRESLLQLLQQPSYRGAPPGVLPGLLMSLHTWGRTLSQHPHVHCLISAGGIDASGAWRPMPQRWLLPVQVLQTLLRSKLLSTLSAALRTQPWVLPPSHTTELWKSTLKTLWRKHFNVELCGPYDHGRGVVLYLARYAKGGPVPAHPCLELLEQQGPATLRMPYLDHRSHQQRTLHITVEEFISRVLWHAPPRGVHTTRHAGLYTSTHRVHHRSAVLALTQATPAEAPKKWPRPSTPAPNLPQTPLRSTPCPHCGLPMLRGRALRALRSSPPKPHHPGENSPLQKVRHLLPPIRSPTRGPTLRSS